MFSSSSLSDDQKALISQWVSEGDDLSALQKRLKEEMDLSITFMDTRFLISDLGLEIVKPVEVLSPIVGETPTTVATDGPAPATGGLRVIVDDDPMAGMLISGLVYFSDGERGMFYIDQTGRPGLDADTPGYQPSEDDIMEFQKQLQAIMIKQQEEFGE